MNNFQAFQPVKINNPELADHGRAGHVTSTERTEGTGKSARQVVDVMLDAVADGPEQSAVSVDVSSLQAL